MLSPSSDPQPLLIELLTEELPPRALDQLGKAFAEGLKTILAQHNLLAPDCTVTDFATPRRLAVLFGSVRQQAPDYEYTEKLMPKRVGLTDSGTMTPALSKRLASKGLGHLSQNDLTIESDGKQDYLLYRGTATGTALVDGLQEALDYSITHLPIPKVMKYQLDNGDSVRFVRPVHSLLALWGDQVVPVHAFGLTADRQTRGHRFAGQGHLRLVHAQQYQDLLAEQGQVIASFDQRRAAIQAQLLEQAGAMGATLGDDPEVTALLDEVTALVEHPTVYAGTFDEAFLAVPPECLILTMRLNQRYFPLFDPATGALTNQFLIVSNMSVDDPTNIIEGNERVVRPRLADAQFFYDTDLNTPLSDRVDTLKRSIYHHDLGSQYDRVVRVEAIAGWLGEQLGANVDDCRRAARLAKADLNSSMVGEFPELQGLMGARYAAHEGENPAVVQAIAHQYDLRLTTPIHTDTLTLATLFIAERAETLVGIWGIGLKPTGERDPFGLRRAALGLISAWEQLTAGGHLDSKRTDVVSLTDLLQQTSAQFPANTLADGTVQEVQDYVLERYRNQLARQTDRRVVDAVLAVKPPMHQIPARVEACEHFWQQPEAATLAAANKRVSNILRKAQQVTGQVDHALLTEPAEQQLAQLLATLAPQANERLLEGDFAGNLTLLAQSHSTVDAFFDQVMIMDKDPDIRANRLSLLAQLHQLLNQVADISLLAS